MVRQPCCDRLAVKKGPWSTEEDKKLYDFMSTHGRCGWRTLPLLAGLRRCGKSCRLRWTNYLRPDLNRGLLTEEEEQLIVDLHAKMGNRWSKIAERMPGRTDNDIKNRWNTYIKKKLVNKGVDPVTHKPLTRGLLTASGDQHSSSSTLSQPRSLLFDGQTMETSSTCSIQNSSHKDDGLHDFVDDKTIDFPSLNYMWIEDTEITELLDVADLDLPGGDDEFSDMTGEEIKQEFTWLMDYEGNELIDI